jgi:putative ABC transport system permease protein
MNRALLLRTVASRLWRFKVRTLFMGLGITVGVLATVLLQSVAMTVTERFTLFIRRAYPADAIVLMSGGGPMSGSANRDRLSLDDIATVVSALSVSEWDPIIPTRREVREGANTARVGINGHSERAESVRELSVRDGEFLAAEDVRSRANVALVGPTTAKNLGVGTGATLFIDNVAFRVKGILASRGLDVHGSDLDDIIVVPYTTLMEKLMRVTYVPAVTMKVDDPKVAKAEIERILRERHQIAEGQEDDFTVLTTEAVMQMFNRSLGTMRIFVPLIAATAFLISALVILSIMQLSIRSRRPEIGLRKAVGARERDLRLQLFLEVMAISLVASLAGLALAPLGLRALMPLLTERLGIQQVAIPIPLIVIAVLAAMATGLIGAMLPAGRAARLDPVAALRSQ